jgi:hypothetical protein
MIFNTLEELRAARDEALSKSDFWLLEDSPIEESLRELKIVEIKLYRQSLRDLPQRAEELGLENVELPPSPL